MTDWLLTDHDVVLSRFSYLISDGICYLTLTDKSYPKRLAFLFLEEISRDFVGDLQEEYGEEWDHLLIDIPISFISILL